MERADTSLPGPLKILKAGIGFTFAHTGRLLVLAILWIVILVAIWAIGPAVGLSGPVLHLINVFVLACFSWIWHRGYLLGAQELTWRPPSAGKDGQDRAMSHGASLMAFAWRAVGLALVVAVLGLLTFVPKYVGPASVARAIYAFEVVYIAAVVIVLTIVLAMPVARILPAFAAISVGERLRWIEAWRLSRGVGWRLALVLIAIGLVDVIIGVVLVYGFTRGVSTTAFAWYASIITPGVIFALAILVSVAIASACNAFMFRELTGWRNNAAQHTKDLAG